MKPPSIRDACTYSVVKNTAAVNPEGIGRRVIFPSKHIGSARNMQQRYQRSLAIMRQFGRPTLFFFTANPHREEVTDSLLTDDNGVPIQSWSDRPDLVARAFHLKLLELLNDIVKVSPVDHIFENPLRLY